MRKEAKSLLAKRTDRKRGKTRLRLTRFSEVFFFFFFKTLDRQLSINRTFRNANRSPFRCWAEETERIQMFHSLILFLTRDMELHIL